MTPTPADLDYQDGNGSSQDHAPADGSALDREAVEARATRALERRFGQTANSYSASWTGDFVRVTDTETGSYVYGAMAGSRFFVVTEHDGAA